MIKIRSHKDVDIPYRVKWLNNPKINKFVGDNLGQKTSLKKQREWFFNYKKDSNKKFFTIIYNNQPIGFMGLSNINNVHNNCDLFIAIGEDNFRGKGLGVYSLNWLLNYGFNKLKLHKINLGVIPDNKSAVNLYKKFGFKVEGTMMEEVRYNNKYYNFLSMALFRKDYKKLNLKNSDFICNKTIS